MNCTNRVVRFGVLMGCWLLCGVSSQAEETNSAVRLRPFIEFLQQASSEPRPFLLKALAAHQVVILGEVHHRPRYWEFNCSLVRDKAFAKQVGVIYLELPANDQALVEEFLACSKYDPQPVIEMLRDMLWMGWPDQAMLDFFKAVWEVNQALPKQQRLRILLVDQKRPWKEIVRGEDWNKYGVDRDQFMAENILADLREHSPGSRHSLFIVGYLHAALNLTRSEGGQIKSAGWHLGQALGTTNVFAVFPHSPVMANMGGVNGRLARGLFESAFVEFTNRRMAFPLEHGPFGEVPFDASMDFVTTNSYREAFNAYLYLGPLENEQFASLIPGFYTDEFVRELDRRFRLDSDKGLVESYHFQRLDAQEFIRWMSSNWAQPRREWSAFLLGPMDAWQNRGEGQRLLVKQSLSRESWAFAGQATPEAALQSALWAVRTGNLESFVACVSPDSKPSVDEFERIKSEVASISAFSVASKEINSAREVIVNVVLFSGGQQKRVAFIMNEVEGKWQLGGKVGQ